uniref:Calpain catalytic domain-containing protein n=1 Tax=Vitrella brassicaformis TaxID=1169539 RepID=A0A7S1P8D4_9ALVE|mmetsp:Transcript_3763/g.8580  ORF Transcript_3763/g.8580 Transcript_3763/m.8580 type:complete len:571 (+) Transcript_3763:264-1976(+)
MGACCSSQGAQQKATAKRTAGAATGGPAGAGAAAAAPAAAAGGPPSRPDDLSPPSEVRDIESSATASRGGTRKPPQEGRSARPLESAPLPASALPVSRLPVPSPDMNLSEENGASKRGGDDAEEDPSIFLEFSPRNASNRIDVFTHPEKPAPLSDQDKERMVNQLINITHLDRGEALSALESCNFDIDEAVGFALAAGASPAMAGASRSELAKRQNQILPSHLKRSQTVSEILLESSIVGQYVMLPWNEADADIRHNFYYEQAASDERRRGARLPNSELFTDPEGQITLSTRQQQRFHEWRRVRNAINEPVIVLDRPSSQCIRQGFVGDCSFLSSLSVLAEFENKSSIPVLTGLLYPQVSHSDANRILPVINPKGMYACRLYFNGVPRRVVIDDHVPVRRDGKLLAAHSSNKREVWVTLLEKAFVKMMGGSYFMQGSNPGSDLYHLTGWIPETIPFKADVHIEGEDPQPHPHPHQHQHPSPGPAAHKADRHHRILPQCHEGLRHGQAEADRAFLAAHCVADRDWQGGLFAAAAASCGCGQCAQFVAVNRWRGRGRWGAVAADPHHPFCCR